MTHETSDQRRDHFKKRETAKLLGISERSLDNWMKRGHIPYMKIGRTVLFHWPDVERHLQQKHGRN